MSELVAHHLTTIRKELTELNRNQVAIHQALVDLQKCTVMSGLLAGGMEPDSRDLVAYAKDLQDELTRKPF